MYFETLPRPSSKYRTWQLSYLCLMVRLAGLEPTASASAGLRSIQLSYKRFTGLLPGAGGWDLNPHARKDTTP